MRFRFPFLLFCYNVRKENFQLGYQQNYFEWRIGGRRAAYTHTLSRQKERSNNTVWKEREIFTSCTPDKASVSLSHKSYHSKYCIG